MSFLLKIVEGPNRGAEVALVEGVAVTLGKGDDCDVVLADPMLPDAPFTIEATSAGVTVDGETLPPFHVRTAGDTSFAIGPSGEAWGTLVWPEPENRESETGDGRQVGEQPAPPASSPAAVAEEAVAPAEKKRHGGCLGCLLWLVVLLSILLGVGWFFMDALRPKVEELWGRITGNGSVSDAAGASLSSEDGSVRECGALAGSPLAGDKLRAIADKYGISFTNVNGRAAVSGNLRTRADRLAATAEAYAAQPGVDLDLSDDESFRIAAEDALFTLTEGALKVCSATNRFLAVTGSMPSADALRKTLESLNADLPKLRNVDVAGVVLTQVLQHADDEAADSSLPGTGVSLPGAHRVKAGRRGRRDASTLPVCGILTTPYPCLVLKNGQRVLEGATIGDSTILKISADSVVVTNAGGMFTWSP